MKLAVLAPLRVEAWALGARRTGMGVRDTDLGDAGAVAIGGVCGAVDPALRPGDIVVASELRDGLGARFACPAASLLVPLLEARGLRVVYGPIVSLDHITSPAERAALEQTGALAVDMESFWLARAAAPRPVAVLRAVVDRAGRRLLDPRTPAAGVRGLLALRRAAPALQDWLEQVEVDAGSAENVEFPRAEEVSR
jgi:4-hydroxy-3-methylbut-2-enyl diphosphate reductase